jgi:hypothetical protein
MKKIILLLLGFFPLLLFSQNKSELGVFGGCSYYMGDINTSMPFYSPGASLGIIYKYNYNPRQVLKLSFNYLSLSAKDDDFDETYQQLRNASYKSTLYDFAAQFEFNFLPFKFADRKMKFSPFVSSGVCGNYSGGNFDFALPATLGIKFALGSRFCTGFEWNLRKTFNDKLDGVKNPGNGNLPIVNNDWYYFAGVFVTYKVFDFIGTCPAYQQKF